MLEVIKGDIFAQPVDAIVNPANTLLAHGGGLARVIADRAGPKLQDESDAARPVVTGCAVVTTAGELPFKAVIHAVGPMWGKQTERQSDVLLASAHKSAVVQATSKGFTSIAFPAISCGVFGFPPERAAPIAIKATYEAMNQHGLHKAVFCLPSDEHYALFEAARKQLLDPSRLRDRFSRWLSKGAS